MSKRTFYPTTFHTNPFAYQQHFIAFALVDEWERSGNAKPLQLSNKTARELEVTKMHLQLSKVTAIDTAGAEHILKDFPAYVELHPKGMDTEFFVRQKVTLSVEKGCYTGFRFYLAEGENSFVYSDRSSETLSGIKHIDFELNSELKIETDADREVLMHFDFKPFSLGSIFHPFKKWFKRPSRGNGKLAGVLAN